MLSACRWAVAALFVRRQRAASDNRQVPPDRWWLAAHPPKVYCTASYCTLHTSTGQYSTKYKRYVLVGNQNREAQRLDVDCPCNYSGSPALQKKRRATKAAKQKKMHNVQRGATDDATERSRQDGAGTSSTKPKIVFAYASQFFLFRDLLRAEALD